MARVDMTAPFFIRGGYMADTYGVKVKLEYENSKSDLRKQLQGLLDDSIASKPLTIKSFKVSSTGLRDALNKGFKDADVPLQLSKIDLNLSSDAINNLQKQFNDKELKLTIGEIDATRAVNNLRSQLVEMLSGLQIGGVKEFLAGESLTSSAEEAENYASNLQRLKVMLSSLNDMGKKLNTFGETEDVRQALELYKQLSKQITVAIEANGRWENVDGMQTQLLALQDMVSAHEEAAKAAKKHAAEEEAAAKKRAAAEEAAAKAAAKQAEADQRKRDQRAAQFDPGLKELKTMYDTLQSYGRKINTFGSSTDVRESVALYQQLNQEMSAAMQNGGYSGDTNDLRQRLASLADLIEGYKKLAAAEKEEAATVKQRSTLSDQIQTWLNQNTKATKDTRTELSNFISELKSPGLSGERLSWIQGRFKQLTATMRTTGNTGKTIFNTLSDGLQKFSGWSAVTAILTTVTRTLRKVYSAVKEVDSAMTELRRVTDLTARGYENFEKAAASSARKVGASLSDTINATADFARLGYSVEEASVLAEAALTYKNIGDGIDDVSEATESLISTIKAFKDLSADDAMYVVDMFNEVGNRFAISSEGIGEALKRSASALSGSGNTIQESIGLITAMNEIIQDPDSVGTTMKTLTMYLRAAKTEAEDAGISVDGMASSVSSLREELLALTGGEVDIMLDDNTFKSTYQVLEDISKVWDKLTDTSHANILNLIGGKRNANSLTALIENFSQASAAMQVAEDAFGSATIENEQYLDSIDGKLAVLKASFEEFSASVLDSGLVKFAAEFLTFLTRAGTWLSDVGVLFPIALAGSAGWDYYKQIKSVKSYAAEIEKIFNSVQAPDGLLDVTQGKNLAGEMKPVIDAYSEALKLQYKQLLMNSDAFKKQSAEVQNAMLETMGLDAVTRTTATGMKALGASIKQAWFSMSLIGQISVVLSILSLIHAVISAITNAQKQANEEALHAANEVIETYQSETKSIEDQKKKLEELGAEYDKLSAGVDENGNNVSLTKEQYSKYLSVVQQIADISPEIVAGYDKQGNAIVLYTNSIEDAIAKQEEYLANQREIVKGNGETLYDNNLPNYKSAIKKVQQAFAGSLVGDAVVLETQNRKAANSYARALYEALNTIGIKYDTELGGKNSLWSSNFTFSETFSYSEIETLIDRSDEFINSLKEARNESGKPLYTNAQIVTIETAITKLKQYNREVIKFEDQQIEYLKAYAYDQEWYQNLMPASMDEFESGLRMINDPYKTYSENVVAAMEYGQQFAEGLHDEQFANLKAQMDAGTITSQEYQERIINMATEWQASTGACDAAAAAVSAYWQSLIPVVTATSDAGDGVASFTQTLDDLADAMEHLQDSRDILSSAQKDIAESGLLSADTLEAIMKQLSDSEDILSYLETENGALRLNEEAWQARTERITASLLSGYEAEAQSLNDWLNGDKAVMLDGYESVDQIQARYDLLNAVVQSIRSLGNEEAVEIKIATFSDMDTAISNARTLRDMMSDSSTSTMDMIAQAQKMADQLNSIDFGGGENTWLSFIIPTSLKDGIDGIQWSEAAIRAYSDAMVDSYFKSLDIAEITPEVIQQFKDVAYTSLTAADGAEKLSSAYSNMLSAVRGVMDIRSGDAGTDILDVIEQGQKMADQLNEIKASGRSDWSWLNFIQTDSLSGSLDDIQWSEMALQAYSDVMIEQLASASGLAETYPDLVAKLKEYAFSALEAADNSEKLSTAFSSISSFTSLLEGMSDGGTNLSSIQTLISLIETVNKNAGTTYNVWDFVKADNGELALVSDNMTLLGESLYNYLITLDEFKDAPEDVKAVLKTLTTSIAEATDETDKLSRSAGEAISNMSSLNSFLRGNAESNGKASLDSLQTLASLVATYNETTKDGTHYNLWDMVSVDESGDLVFLTDQIAAFTTANFDAMTSMDGMTGASEAEQAALKKLLDSMSEAVEEAESLSSALGNLSSFNNFYQSVNKKESGLDAIQSAASIVEMVNSTLSEGDQKYNIFDLFSVDAKGNLAWATDSVDKLGEAYFAYLKSMDSMDGATTEQIEYLRTLAFTLADAATGAKTLSESYASLKSAITGMPPVSDMTELTYDAFEELIEVDKRYATAIRYQNGMLYLNRDAYAKVTEQVVEANKAQAVSEISTILTSEKYIALSSRIGALTDAEQQELDGMNAKIAGYRVLISELNNASSAYQRFVNASAETSSSRYSAARQALEVINDTLSDAESDLYGKIGREQFVAAKEYLIDPDIKINTPKFDAAMKTVERYLEDGSAGITNFYDDLVAGGFIGAGNVLNANMETIASTLGVSMDFLRSLFDELNEYQTEDNKVLIDFESGELDSGVKTAEEQLAELQAQVGDFNSSLDIQHEISIDSSAAESALGKVATSLSGIIDLMNTINGKTITSRVNIVQTSNAAASSLFSSLFSRLGGNAAAGGTFHAAGGRTLVGEIGMETVIDPQRGTWRTVGRNGAEFVNLPRGAIVLNAAQTRNLFTSGHSSGGQGGKAMASGNAGSLFGDMFDMINDATKTIADASVQIAKSASKSGKNETASGTPERPNGKDKSDGSGGGNNLGSLADQYEEINKQLEHLIRHQEHLYEVAENGLDYPAMEASLTEQANLYRKMMEKAQETVNAMIAAGADDTNEELQKVEESYWSAYTSLYDTIDHLGTLYTEALNNKIDGIQTGYSNFATLIKELNDTGKMSIDTFQSLGSHGLEYLNYLQLIDGQYVVNEEAVSALIAAEKEQLAIEQALSYVSSIRQALMDGAPEKVSSLVNLTNQIGEGTWDLVYANAAMLKTMGLTNEQYEDVIHNIDTLKDLSLKVNTSLAESSDAYKDQEDALDKILDFTKQLIRYETEEKIDAINEEVEAYQKIVDLRKEALKTAKDESDYTSDVAEKTKEIASLETRIAQLTLDDTREARAERASLEEELAKLQGELADLQGDHAYDMQIDALDKEAEKYQETREEEIKSLEEQISSEEKLYQEALKRIDTGWKTLYNDLITWNTEAGSVLNSEITKNWDLALDAAKRYGSYVEAIVAKTGNPYTLATTEVKELPVYHQGGVVAASGIHHGEVVAVLEEGEEVLTKKQRGGLYRIVDFAKELSAMLGTAIGEIKLPALSVASSPSGMASGVMPEVSQQNNITFSPEVNVNISHSGTLSESDARAYGKLAGGAALDEMRQAFARRGIGSALGGLLKA